MQDWVGPGAIWFRPRTAAHAASGFAKKTAAVIRNSVRARRDQVIAQGVGPKRWVVVRDVHQAFDRYDREWYLVRCKKDERKDCLTCGMHMKVRTRLMQRRSSGGPNECGSHIGEASGGAGVLQMMVIRRFWEKKVWASIYDKCCFHSILVPDSSWYLKFYVQKGGATEHMQHTNRLTGHSKARLTRIHYTHV